MRISIKQRMQYKHSGRVMNNDYRESTRMELSELGEELSISQMPAQGAIKPPFNPHRG